MKEASAYDINRYTDEKRRRIVQRLEDSGLSAEEFGRSYGIGASALRRWRQAIKREAAWNRTKTETRHGGGER